MPSPDLSSKFSGSLILPFWSKCSDLLFDCYLFSMKCTGPTCLALGPTVDVPPVPLCLRTVPGPRVHLLEFFYCIHRYCKSNLFWAINDVASFKGLRSLNPFAKLPCLKKTYEWANTRKQIQFFWTRYRGPISEEAKKARNWVGTKKEKCGRIAHCP